MVEIDYSVRGMLYDYDYDCIRYREICLNGRLKLLLVFYVHNHS